MIRIEKSIQLKFVKYRKNVTVWIECFWLQYDLYNNIACKNILVLRQQVWYKFIPMLW